MNPDVGSLWAVKWDLPPHLEVDGTILILKSKAPGEVSYVLVEVDDPRLWFNTVGLTAFHESIETGTIALLPKI